jgi:hypothetical protein
MTIGVYAENNDPKSLEIKQELNQILKDYPYVLQNHGFYLDEAKMIVNFDLVISFDDLNPLNTIDEIKNKIKAKFNQYEFIIQFDQDFSLSE